MVKLTINYIKQYNNRLLYTVSMAAVLLMLLTSCTGAALKPADFGEVATKATEKEIVVAEFDPQTLYALLAGEIAGQQGDMATALKYYLPAAENNEDTRIAARAARIAIYAKQNDLALRASKRWLALSPDDQQAMKISIIALLRSNQAEAAGLQMRDLIKSIRQDEQVTDKQAFAAVAKLLQNEAETSDAVLVFKSLSHYYKDNAQVFLWLSRYAMQAGQYDQALPAISRVIELDPENAKAYVLKGRLLALSGKQVEALQAMLLAVNKQPDDFMLRKQYAGMLIRQSKLEDASAQFEILFKVRPDDRETIISLGILLLEKNDTERAVSVFKRLQNNPQSANEALYYLGRVDEVKKNYSEALARYQQVEQGRLYFDAQLRIASLFAYTDQLESAVKTLQALVLGEDNSEKKAQVYLLHGRILQNAGDSKSAIAIYSSALDELPTNIELLYAHALAAESLDMIDSAVAGFKKLLTHEPENIQALNALGYTLADRTERFQEALEYILKAFKLKPDDSAILDSLGWVKFRLGKLDEALKWLQQAFEINVDAEIAAHLGEVLWKMGRIDDANEVWQNLPEEMKQHRRLQETIKRLKK
ncbi:MAG: tetratricopeptide repeat protein [Gammaproteobacteria bacterium]|nr:tetratricopeptide repeat protein [Gammaproteobacteria bacterium]